MYDKYCLGSNIAKSDNNLAALTYPSYRYSNYGIIGIHILWNN